MTQAEKYAWGSLVTTGFIFWFFQNAMLDGWQVRQMQAPALLGKFVITIIMFVVAEAIIAGSIALMGGSDDIEKDERDLLIEMKAEQNASWFMGSALLILIGQMLIGGVIRGHEFVQFDLTQPSSLFFVLYSVVIIATIVQRVSTLALYGMASARA